MIISPDHFRSMRSILTITVTFMYMLVGSGELVGGERGIQPHGEDTQAGETREVVQTHRDFLYAEIELDAEDDGVLAVEEEDGG
ncbi:unnamed protein product [Sphagnum balticum]